MTELDFSIREKLLKIKALVDDGKMGEMSAAKLALEKMLKKYDLTIEDLCDEAKMEERQYYWFKISNDTEVRKLFTQCYCKVMETFRLSYKKGNKYDTLFGLNLTLEEYIEFDGYWNFHLRQWKKEKAKMIKAACSAYIQKHEIFPDISDEEMQKLIGKEKPKKKKSLSEWMMISSLMDVMENVSYRKQLGDGTAE